MDKRKYAQVTVYMKINKGNHHVSALAEAFGVNAGELRAKLSQDSKRISGSFISRVGGGWFKYSN